MIKGLRNMNEFWMMESSIWARIQLVHVTGKAKLAAWGVAWYRISPYRGYMKLTYLGSS